MRSITKGYGDGYPAVKDIDLEIGDGEFMILVGPSGCGKSTMLRMIGGLENITSGDMLIGGRRVNEKAPRDRNLAMVFQNYALYPHLSVYENIGFPLRLKGMPDSEVKQRVEKVSDVLELDEHLSASRASSPAASASAWRWAAPSSGEADAFLFDEPLSNLDAKLRGQMRTELSRLQRRLGITRSTSPTTRRRR